MMTDSDGLPQSEGLRARKQRQTHARICAAALRLFIERGYEGATLDAIAEAADISRRSLFHYFESKEAIVQALESSNLEALRSAVLAAPPDMSPLDRVQHGLRHIIAIYQTEDAMQINRLMRSNEALRARKQANYQQQEQVVFEALRSQWPDPARLLHLQLIAMAGIGALRIAAERWTEASMQRPLTDYLDEAFDCLRLELTPG